jgi:hypothetical protein
MCNLGRKKPEIITTEAWEGLLTWLRMLGVLPPRPYIHFHGVVFSHREIFSLRGSVVGSATMLQAGRSRVLVPIKWIFFFNLPNPSSRTMPKGRPSL